MAQPRISRRGCSARFAGDIKKHILRREIIATGLTNAIVNRGGPVLTTQMTDETGHGKGDVALAFMAVREVFELPQLWQRIDALDGKLGGSVQLSLYEATQELVRTETLWFLHDGKAIGDLAGTIARHGEGLNALKPAIEDVMPARLKEHIADVEQRFVVSGVPADLAADVARLEALELCAGHHRDRRWRAPPHPARRPRVLRGGRAFPHPRPGRQGGGDRRARHLRPAGDRPCGQ